MRVKVYQIQTERDKNNVKFRNYEETERHGGVNFSAYQCVFAGDIRARNLDDVYHYLNQGMKPTTYQGHSLSMSDVVEVIGDIPEVYGYIDYYGSNGKVGERYYVLTKDEYDKAIAEDVSCGRPHKGHIIEEQHMTLAEKGFFFCDDIGWKQIDFDPSQAESMRGVRALMIQPHQRPIETHIVDELACWQRAVSDHGEDALIEVTYPFDDNAVVIGNEEAKLISMDGNRRIEGSVYAGPLFIVGDKDGEFTDLTDDQMLKYAQMFEEPEEISQDEVEADCGFSITSW